VSYTACFISRWHTDAYRPHEPRLSKTKRLRVVSFLVSRGLLLFIFTAFYVAFAVLFGLRLADWENKIAGLCYHSDNIALSSAAHPAADRAYLIATSLLMGLALAGCLVLNPRAFGQIWGLLDIKSTDEGRVFVLGLILLYPAFLMFLSLIFVSFGQYPLHLYMAVKIRMANEKFLSGDSENSWGFGQIVPLVLLIPIIRDIGKAYIGMFLTRGTMM